MNRLRSALPLLSNLQAAVLESVAPAAAKELLASTPAVFRGYARLVETHATTILCIRRDGEVVMIGDGQVTKGEMVVKPNAKKIRRIGDSVVAGFAGSAADGIALLERLEAKLDEYPGQLMRASVELAKMWRQDKALRYLQAELLVADAATTLCVSGNGDVLEAHDSAMAIGSGSGFALAAARALLTQPGVDAATIASTSMKIASDMCIFTNSSFVTEALKAAAPSTAPAADGSAANGSTL